MLYGRRSINLSAICGVRRRSGCDIPGKQAFCILPAERTKCMPELPETGDQGILSRP
jgi:hypothetical protein